MPRGVVGPGRSRSGGSCAALDPRGISWVLGDGLARVKEVSFIRGAISGSILTDLCYTCAQSGLDCRDFGEGCRRGHVAVQREFSLPSAGLRAAGPGADRRATGDRTGV